MPHSKGIAQIAIGIVVIAPIIWFSYFFWHGIGTPGGAEQFPLIWFIWIAAILGSLVNETSRDTTPDKTAPNRDIVLYILWKCVIASIFATALYMMLRAGLISGDIFPKFLRNTVEQGGVYTNMMDFATKVVPGSFNDVAKILVWSFIAGYSEKFVPNLISDTLSAASNKKRS